jgi:hypothetical protein
LIFEQSEQRIQVVSSRITYPFRTNQA